jgi:hypothetical protein
LCIFLLYLYLPRASASPAIDVFITLLSMGAAGWKRLLAERKELFGHLKEEMVGTALHCTALHCTALHCTALQYSVLIPTI